MDAYAKSVIKMVLEMSRKRKNSHKGFERSKIRKVRDGRDLGNRHDMFDIKKGRNRRSEINKKNREFGKVVLKFDGLFEDYLHDVEKCTGRKISKEQRDLIRKEVESGRCRKLTPSENSKNRSAFNGRKSKIIAEWEEHNHEKWPTYKEPVVTRKGKIARLKGGRYDAHHLVECSWNGSAEWYNMHPAKHPDEHQWSIHRKGGYCDRIDNLLKGA
jgi:predicted ribonuclease toxin of YeeF-YezG toxin-antitoxin module